MNSPGSWPEQELKVNLSLRSLQTDKIATLTEKVWPVIIEILPKQGDNIGNNTNKNSLIE